jgi:hypothetical protein
MQCPALSLVCALALIAGGDAASAAQKSKRHVAKPPQNTNVYRTQRAPAPAVSRFPNGTDDGGCGQCGFIN